ncbi:hypothetical protein [Kitasatospora kifunensis]|uniref:Uncharacterized protein n=1 Tax=Kitasatospora kifunensis TaxID=58351 RepID=A0A7W7W094_KITKI|nr:hypothetical protein [Kitasatospora kifunensis]MBB4928933.1 hypothetical protein [Kitasatospora kifunensis]
MQLAEGFACELEPLGVEAFGGAQGEWDGAPVGNGPNPAVPTGTRQVPMLFGGYSTRALGDTETGQTNIRDFYQLAPEDIAGNVVLCTTPQMVRQSVADYADLGVNEIIFVPATDNLDEVTRLADIVT